VTEGLDGLRDRLAEYIRMGARFAKWRAVITIGMVSPVGVAFMPTHMLWLAMRRYAKKQVSSCR